MTVTNLYEHADGGFYCLLIDDAPMKHPSTGEWIPGVVYVGTDGKPRSTSTERFAERFIKIDYDLSVEDESLHAMVRRCNPDLDFSMEDVWAGWHETESAISSELIELAVCSTVAAVAFNDNNALSFVLVRDEGLNVLKATITLKPQHLRHILTNYAVSQEQIEDGYKISLMRKDA